MTLTKLFNEFFASEKGGGLILVFVTLFSLGLANSPWQTGYIHFWHLDLGGHSITHWINDGFTMSIFITLLAFDQPETIIQSKIAILIASFGAGGIGYLWLRMTLAEQVSTTDN